MTDSNVIHAEVREDVGKGASRRLRHQGKIPAVIYGGKKDPATLTIAPSSGKNSCGYLWWQERPCHIDHCAWPFNACC